MLLFDPKTICPFWDDAEFQEAWLEWFNGPARLAKKCSSSDRAVKMALGNIMRNYRSKEQAIKGIDYSAYKGYTDVGYKVPDDFQQAQQQDFTYEEPAL
jgi:hypothetical protein